MSLITIKPAKNQYIKKQQMFCGTNVSEKHQLPVVKDIVSFSSSPQEKQNPVSPVLHSLFKALPKTELHLHLSGSTPLSTIKEILREKGHTEKEIAEETNINTDFNGLDDFLKTYYKVAWQVKTPEHFKKAAYQICMDAASENVKYLEIRTSAIGKVGSPDETLQAVTDGINKAKDELKSKGFDQQAKIIVLAQRHHDPKEALEHAKLAEQWAKKPDSLVVGFDLAGSEGQFPVTFFKEAIEYAKNSGLDVTIHAGETDGSTYKPDRNRVDSFGVTPVEISGAESIRKAVEYGADRLGHAVHLYDEADLVKLVKEKDIAVESPPKCNVQLGSVDSYAKHPIKKMLDDGVKVSLSTDNRTISNTTLTDEYELLYKNKVITDWNDIKKLAINGARSVFLPPAEKQQLVEEFKEDLKQIESNPVFKNAIDNYLTPCKKAISFVGVKINQMLGKEAA